MLFYFLLKKAKKVTKMSLAFFKVLVTEELRIFLFHLCTFCMREKEVCLVSQQEGLLSLLLRIISRVGIRTS
uniref:Uncharacterized protein n=1 Tax=Anguilla anguilla TaxID=7936 RepID=A0A0E9WUQ0_ANGAN